MITSLLDIPGGRAPRVLLIGAHCDDIEIGCGGTLQVLASRFPALELSWTVFSAPPQRAEETKRAAELLLPAGTKTRFDLHTFRESYFPYVGAEVKDCMQAIAARLSPDLVLTHFAGDKHQDHRVLSELTANAFRDHLIFEYEIVKYDADLAQPNVFVPVTKEQTDRKVVALMTAFSSQTTKYWFTEDTFTSLMRLRGIESRSPSGYAEAFHCRKLRMFA